jgi:hypothetical protein
MEKSSRLTQTSGNSDNKSEWAKARVVQSDQLLKQLGYKLFEPGEDFRPIDLHAGTKNTKSRLSTALQII